MKSKPKEQDHFAFQVDDTIKALEECRNILCACLETNVKLTRYFIVLSFSFTWFYVKWGICFRFTWILWILPSFHLSHKWSNPCMYKNCKILHQILVYFFYFCSFPILKILCYFWGFSIFYEYHTANVMKMNMNCKSIENAKLLLNMVKWQYYYLRYVLHFFTSLFLNCILICSPCKK